MKQLIILVLTVLLAVLNSEAQSGKTISGSSRTIGIKGGYNIAKLTGSGPDFKPDTQNGFMIAGFLAPANRSGIGFRTELVFSRQGFGFDENGKTSNVTSDYLYLPQFTTIGITKYVQLQIGGQVGYLLKSSLEKESEGKSDITSLANRLDYGAAFGAEIYPVKQLVLGVRYNMSFGNSFKTPESSSPIPSPLPFTDSDVKSRNAVINLFAGFRF